MMKRVLMRRLAGVDRCGVVVLVCSWKLVCMWSGPAIDVAVNFEVDSHQRQERPALARRDHPQ
jgi:hypothetical protein